MAALTISPEEVKRVKGMGFLSNRGTDNFSGRIITVNGKITAPQSKCISEAAEIFGNGTVTMTTRLTIEIPGIPFEKIEDFRSYIAKEGLVTGGTGAKIRPVVACKGTTCQYGLLDSFGLSEEIHKRFFEGYSNVKLPHKFKIAVGGCPNNCMKPDLNDIGIVGQNTPDFEEDLCKGCKKCTIEAVCPVGAAKVSDRKMSIDKNFCLNCGRCVGKCRFHAIKQGTPGYKIYIGGRWGKQVSIGKALGKIFTSRETALDVMEKAILLYKEQGQAGERFSKTIERIGFKTVETELLSNDLLERKKDILNA